MKAVLLLPLTAVYRAAIFLWDFYWQRKGRVSLPVRVISIGGLTAGGSGKTSMTAYLAAGLISRWGNPAVVALGYKRIGNKDIVVSDEPNLKWEDCGDEPAVLAKSVPKLKVYVSGNKSRAASWAAREGHAPVIIDDGFQHRKLNRDIDIVCLDGTDPFGNGMMLPSGRLREPQSALERASIIVIIDPPESGFRSPDKIPSGKPVFTARKVITGMKSLDGGSREVEKAGCLAFCGIGNPRSFRSSLERSSLEALAFMEFPDHHRYSSKDLENIIDRFKNCRADLIITTLKDAVRLGKIWNYDHPLYYLEIMIELEREEEFFGLLER